VKPHCSLSRLRTAENRAVARLSRLLLTALVWASLTAIACTVGSSGEPPPTVAAILPTLPPVSTLGYHTPIPSPALETLPTIMPSQAVATTLYTKMGQVDGDRLIFHIDSLVHVHSRHAGTVGWADGRGISAAYEYIRTQYDRIGLESEGRFFYESQSFRMPVNGEETNQQNLIGTLQGSDPNAGVIVVGAHYDSRTDDIADAESEAPGADDNGSGVAAVIELARIMSRRQPRMTVLFVLFAGEEQGYKGSLAFVDEYITPNKFDVQMMINLDTIGSWNDAAGNINETEIRLFAEPSHAPSRYLAEMITFIAHHNRTPLNVMLQDASDRVGRFGDHKAFTLQGYAAVRFVEALEDTRNRESRDTIDGIEQAYLVKSTQTVLIVLAVLADGPRPPDVNNIIVRDTGSGTRRLVWEQIPGAVRYIVALRMRGARSFGEVFPINSAQTAWDCECFTSDRFAGLAIAAVSPEGIMGPLSLEYVMP
jgi:hypothetical protein